MTLEALRASDADRDQVAEVLHTARSQGRISSEECAERLEVTLRAKTFGDLLPLTADLIPAPTPPAVPTPPRPGQGDRMTAFLSETKRDGNWRVHVRSYASVFGGSIILDFTGATFEAPVVEINVTNLLGSLVLRVADGTTIRDETASVLGSTSIKGIRPGHPACPTLVLRGTNVLGEIKVRGPKKASLWRRALP